MWFLYIANEQSGADKLLWPITCVVRLTYWGYAQKGKYGVREENERIVDECGVSVEVKADRLIGK